VALQLRKLGIRHVRPLLGGFYEWKQLGFPLVEITPPEVTAAGPTQIAAPGPA
jgi:3-mercaptopyruvate sulfurtransferase SseA